MRKFFKMGAYGLLSMALATGFSSCHDDDPDYDDVTPPTVAVAPNTVSGVISAMSGTPVSGATVTLDTETATTNADGVYLFSGVSSGTHSIKVTATGKVEQSGTITIEDVDKTQNAVWNALMPEDRSEEINVTVGEGGEGAVESEFIEGNDNAKVTITATVPEDVVSEDTKIEIAPIYTEASATVQTKGTRAGEDAGTMLIGATISCSGNVTLSKAIDLGFELDGSMTAVAEAKKYVNGEWVPVNSRIENNKVIIEALEFTSYGLFLNVGVSVSKGSENISFTQSKWDNLYGSRDMQVSDAAYTYKVGTEINSRGTTVLEALLIEHLARLYGEMMIKNLQGTYPINVTLPIGTILQISGTQEKNNITVSAHGRSVKGTNYGSVTVVVATANRNHTGSSN